MGLFKTAARLGDTIRGYLDFSASKIPCYSCKVRAETCEVIDLIADDQVLQESSKALTSSMPFFTLPIDVIYSSQGKGNLHSLLFLQ